MRRYLVISGLFLLPAVVVFAQQEEPLPENGVLEGEDGAPDSAPDAEEEDGGNGFLTRFIQDLLSAPGRTVRIRNVSGILSSEASIGRIEVSDDDGVWLRIDDVVIDWSRAALFLRRIDISSLRIGEIAYLRPPLPPERETPTLADAAAEPFSLPELPLAVRVAELAIGEISLGEPVFGQAATLTTEGFATLEGGELDTELAIRRLDDPGGSLTLQASFSNRTRQLALDLALSEPEGGVVASMLDIEGRPAIDMTLAGAGPLEDLDIDFDLAANDRSLARGEVALRESDDGLAFSADFTGELSPLIPADYRDFFAGESSVRVAGVNLAAGGLRLDEIAVAAEALDLDGSLETGPDRFLRRLALTGRVGSEENGPVTLPVPGGETTLRSGTLDVSYGEGDRWRGDFALRGLASPELGVDEITLAMGGRAENLEDPASRNVTIEAEGTARGFSSPDPAIVEALGESIDLRADIAIAPDAPLAINGFEITGAGLSLTTSGTVEDLVYDGSHAIRADDLTPFSALAGRNLGGSVDLVAEGALLLASGGFDLALDGTATDLRLGIPQVDPLLAGETTIDGRLRRDETGFVTDALRIESGQFAFTSSGRVSGDDTDIAFDARIADVGLVLAEASGEVTAEGRATGTGGPITVTLEAAMDQGALLERSVTGLAFAFDGTVSDGDIAGALSGEGNLDGHEIALAGDIAVAGEERRLDGLRFAVGANTITGNLTRTGDAPIEGRLELAAPNVTPLAALALVEAAGAADATLELGPAAVGQGISLDAAIRDLAVEGNTISILDLEARIEDAFGIPLADATATASDISAGGLEITRLDARAARGEGERMDFSAETRLAVGTEVALAGGLERLAGGFAFSLERLTLDQDAVSARLAAPSTITVRGPEITLTPLALDIGDGRIEAEGSVGERLDLALAIDALALSVANAILPDLGLEGTVNGNARVTGTRNAPQVDFDLAASNLLAAAGRDAGLPPVSVRAEGTTDGAVLDVVAGVTAPGGIDARATGAVPLAEGGAFDLAVEIASLPLAALDPLAGNQGLQGNITGSANVTGTLAAPAATFSLSGSGLSARILRENAVPALAATAEGRFAQDTVTLSTASLTGPDGISASASGTIPLTGAPLALSAAGSLPLALANPFLAERTTELAGTASFDLSIGGSLTDPQVTGPITINGATFVDPNTNIRLENIALDASLAGDSVTIASLTANSARGGRLSVSGDVGLAPAAGFPVDLDILLNNIAYTDGSFLTTRLSGALTIEGPVANGGGLLAGEITLDETEISVAEGFGASAAGALADVEHRATPEAVRATLERARAGQNGRQEATAGGPGLGLDLLVRAPNQIFIRGRGLDAELGGQLVLRGTVSDIQPVGQFDLIRGRLDLLGQRIAFDEGSLQLVGTLDPIVNFVARTETEDATAIVTVSGRASEPAITFSSIPELPEDEVLARLLFDRSVGQLSPFQLAQLAAAAAELAGAGGNGLLSQFRGAVGLDDLEIITDAEGGAGVRAGRYIDDNIYVDVETGTGGETRFSVNLDITDAITARGTVGSQGDSTLGIYYERDY